MAPKMVVNVPGYEGEYEFDMNAQLMSPREWRWIRDISGYLPAGDNSFIKGLEGLDPDLFVAFAVIAMVRSGKIERNAVPEVAELLRDPPFDGASVVFSAEEEEAEEVPPGSGSDTNSSPPASGESGSEDSDASPESSEARTSGIQDWATGSQDSLQASSRT